MNVPTGRGNGRLVRQATGGMPAAGVVDVAERCDRAAVEVCMHCGHPIEHHDRRQHRTNMRYTCHEWPCSCTFDLLHVE